MLLFGCRLLIGGYCFGSFVYWVNCGSCVVSFVVCVCVYCCCRGFGVRVGELELVGVVWDEVVCVDLCVCVCGGGGGGYCMVSFVFLVNMVEGYCVGSFVRCVRL